MQLRPRQRSITTENKQVGNGDDQQAVRRKLVKIEENKQVGIGDKQSRKLVKIVEEKEAEADAENSNVEFLQFSKRRKLLRKVDVKEVEQDIMQDWSEEQCQFLWEGVSQFLNTDSCGDDAWRKIAALVPGKSVQDCVDKYHEDIPPAKKSPKLPRKYQQLINISTIKLPVSNNQAYIRRKLRETISQKYSLQDFGLSGSIETPAHRPRRIQFFNQTLECRKQIQKYQSFSKGHKNKKSSRGNQKQKKQKSGLLCNKKNNEKLMLELSGKENHSCKSDELSQEEDSDEGQCSMSE